MVASRRAAWRVRLAARSAARARDRAVRLPPSAWARLLGDAQTVAAYHALVHRRGPGEHWFWLGPISDSGGAKLRSCNPAHWVLGTRKNHAADYITRKPNPFSPLADRRGPAGRARAIRDAILRAQAQGADGKTTERAVKHAMNAGMPGRQEQLF